MVPWRLLDRARIPGGGGELTLHARGAEYSIRIDGQELMNSRHYCPVDALSLEGCARIQGRREARVLIGGLGVGYALATALAALGSDAAVVVAELSPAVIGWNRGVLGHLAGHPLRDPRVALRNADVARVLKQAPSVWDAILLDVDNGPRGLTRRSNDWLYSRAGLACARRALRPRGVLGIWSAGPDRDFLRRLRGAGFAVEEQRAPARGQGRGARHTIWLAVPSSGPAGACGRPGPR